jgi:tetratricopeptide (TPR) repeat protein
MKQALEGYIQVKSMQERLFGMNSLPIADTLSNIGLIQYQQKRLSDAFDSYQEALRIRRELFGTDENPDIAATLNSIGLILYKQGMFNLAKQCFAECVALRTKMFGKTNRDVSIAWYNLGTVTYEMGEEEEAIQMYKESIRIENEILQQDDPDKITTIQHIAQIYQRSGRFEDAERYFLQILDIENNRETKRYDVLGSIYNLLGNVYLQGGQTNQMMQCYIEASRIYESKHVPTRGLVISGYNQYHNSKINPPCAAVA